MTTSSPPPPVSAPDAVREVAARLDDLPLGRWHARIVALVGVGTFFNFFEVALGSLLVTLLPAGWIVGTADKALVLAAPFVGELLGALFLAPLSDRFGRRRMFQVNLATYGLLAVLSAFAPGFAVFVVLRVAVGIGLGAELVLVDTYLAEVVPARSRGRLIGACYAIGMLAVPICGLLAAFLPHRLAGLDSWQWLLVLSASGAVIVVVLRRGLPESPRWLASRGRIGEALAALPSSDGSQDHGRLLTAPAPAPAPSPDRTTTDAAPVRLLGPALRGRTLLACVIWACQTIGFYGFSTIAPLVLISKGFDVVESLGYVALTAFGYPIGAVVMTALVERVERRSLLIASSVLVAVLGVAFGVATAPVLIVAAGTLLTLANVVMGNTSHAYAAELFPTEVRTTAAGRTYSLSRLVSAVLPFATLTILYALGAGVLFGLCALLIAAMAVTVAAVGPRTNARRLESI